MRSDDELHAEIERLQNEQRQFRRAHRLFREQVREMITSDVHQHRSDLENLCLTIAANGGMASQQDVGRLAALLALTDDRALEIRLRGLENAPDVSFSPLPKKEFDRQLAAFDKQIQGLQAELRDRERQRRHEAVDAEFA